MFETVAIHTSIFNAYFQVLLFLLASQESKGFDLEYEDIKSSEEDFDDGEVPNDLSKFNSTNKVYQRSNDRQDNPMVIECGDKVKANQFVDTNEFEPLWFASTNYPDNYPKKQKYVVQSLLDFDF